MKHPRIATILLLLLLTAIGSSAAKAQYALSDSVANASVQSSYGKAWAEKPWLSQLIDNGFRINDPGINYPRFARFCLKVYNWGDRTFNSYDPEYVVGTGKNWKVLGSSYNWAESYALFFSDRTRVEMISDVYSDIGGSIHFMAVSLGYMFNANELIHRPTATRSNFDFSFTCALFTLNLHTTSTKGGSRIVKFGSYKNPNGRRLSYDFNDVHQSTTSLDGYYFFNHRKYSHAAAYCFSKYQLRSAGSWVAGLSFLRQDISLDLASLPEEMLRHLPDNSQLTYNFYAVDYCLSGGYAYNHVIRPRKWLFNITVLPSLGYKHFLQPSESGRKDMLSSNIKTTFALVYNHRALFAGMMGRLDVRLFTGSAYQFVNSQGSLTLSVGARF